MALMPESLKEGDKITALTYRPDNSLNYAHATVVGHSSAGRVLLTMDGIRFPGNGLRYEDIDIWWIRGWHYPESVEFSALLAAHKLRERPL